MNGYKFEIEDPDGRVIPHWDEASNMSFDKTNTNLAATNVQAAIEELARGSSSPVHPSNVVSGYYTILASEWGLTKSDAYPERGKAYCATKAYLETADASLLEQYNVSSEITYEDMHNNAIGIEKAIDYAYAHGYHGVVLENGIYYIIPENVVTTSKKTDINSVQYDAVTFRGVAGSITILDKENFTIDLNGSAICAVVNSNPPVAYEGDLSFVNSYYKQYKTTTITNTSNKPESFYDYSKPTGDYKLYSTAKAHYISLFACKQVTIRNGIIRGDRYTRTFAVTNEAKVEQSYGISTGLFSHHCRIEDIDISGCMGDAISTSAYGSGTLIRNEDGVFKELVTPQHTFRCYNFHANTIDGKSYSSGNLDVSEGHKIPYYKSKGWTSYKNQSNVTNRLESECPVMSAFISVANPIDYGFYKSTTDNKKALDVNYIDKLWKDRKFSVSCSYPENGMRIGVLIYSFPNDIATVTIDDFDDSTLNGTYKFEISARSRVVSTLGSSIDLSRVPNKDTNYRLWKVVDNTDTLIGTTNSNYKTIIAKVVRKIYNDIAPTRIVETAPYNDVTFKGSENWCRIQLFWHSKDYNNDAFDTGEFGEVASYNSSDGKWHTVGLEVNLYLACNDKLLVNNCLIHDNHRGGITGGVKNLTVTNCKFEKPSRNATDTMDEQDDTGDESMTYEDVTADTEGNMPAFASNTNYAIDIEDSAAFRTEIAHCVFNKPNAGVLVVNCDNFIFHHNVCFNRIGAIQKCSYADIHDNLFFSGGFAFAENDTHYRIVNDTNKRKRVIDFHHNLCHNYENQSLFRNIENTIVKVTNNVLYLAPTSRNGKYGVVATGIANYIQTVIDKTRNNIFENNTVYGLYDEFILYNSSDGHRTYGFVGTGIVRNNIINYEGNIPTKFVTLFVSPNGVNSGNIVNGGTLFLGQRRAYQGFQNLGTDRIDGINCFNAIKATVRYGDPTTKTVIGNSAFHNVLTLAYEKVSYTGANIPLPPIITPNAEDRYTGDRRVTLSINPDNATMMQTTELVIYYTLDGTTFFKGAVNSSVELTVKRTAIIDAYVQTNNSSKYTSPTSELYILANEEPQYAETTDENDEVVYEEVEEINYEPEYGSFDAPPSGYDPTLNFVQCIIDKPIKIETVLTSTKPLTINCIQCNFTDNDDNCLIAAHILAQSYDDEASYSSGRNGDYYYYPTEDKLYVCSNKKLRLLNLTINTSNCVTNDDFSVIKDIY